MRKPNTRCGLKFCTIALSVFYDQDLNAIQARGRDVEGVDFSEHCPEEEASYIFKCPRCEGACACSICRKKLGAGQQLFEKAVATNKVSATGSRLKSEGDLTVQRAPKEAKESKAPKQDKEAKKPKQPKAEGSAPKAKKADGGPASAKGKQKQNGTAAESGSSPAGKKKGKSKDTKDSNAAPAKSKLKEAFGNKAKQLPGSKPVRQTALPRKLKAPVAVPAPELEIIKTALNPANVWSRIWIYETLVRFDLIRVPKGILSQLDKFDAWTHRQVQMILERVLVALAGVSSIHNGQPKARVAPAVKLYRQFGDDLKRGEPWSAAKDLAQSFGCVVPELPHVERVFGDESKEPVASEAHDHEQGPTLLGSRMTRTRRAAEVRALERVKQQSIYDFERDAPDSDTDDEISRKSNRRTVHKDREEWAELGDAESSSDEHDARDDADSDEEAPMQAGGRVSDRRSGRTQAASASDVEEGARRSGRQRNAPTSTRTSAPRTAVRAISVSEGSSRSGASSLSPELESEKTADDTKTSISSVAPATAPAVQEPIPAPEMEEKVAILHALLGTVLETPEVAEELKMGANRLPDIEKWAREDMKQLEKDWEEEKKLINTNVPSMAQANEFAKWKREKEKKEKKHKLAVLDIKVNAHRETESHKLRSGPLGVDADGREYWQLTEFNDQMPRDTAGRWAWCLLIFGEPLTKHAPAPEDMKNGAANISPMKPSVKDEDVDGDVKMQEGKAAAGVSTANKPNGNSGETPHTPRRLALEGDGESKDAKPAQKGAGSDASSDLSSVRGGTPREEEAAPRPVFMGTNYVPSFKDIIAFLRYRCAQREYEELKEQQDSEQSHALAAVVAAAAATSATTAGGSSGASPPSPEKSGTGAVGRKAKKQLKEMQEARRARVEALCKRLVTVKDYYVWHSGEPEEGEV